jgi:hypothetical protein
MENQTKNLYKLSKIFKCVHDVHKHFKSEMSPYHILNEKKCFPYGCVYFKWKCKLLAKKKRCFRNFTTVGKECFNCKFFYEEKIHQYPVFLPTNLKPDDFFAKFNDFEEWVERLKQNHVLCEGIVKAIRPDLVLYEDNNLCRLRIRGFLVSFNNGYIDNQIFDDRFYLSVSQLTQSKLKIKQGDEIEFHGRLNIDKGRFKFIKSRNFQFYNRGAGNDTTQSEIIVASKTFTIQHNQPKKCLNCKKGLLVDVISQKPGPRRKVICLNNVNNHKSCLEYLSKSAITPENKCINLDWNRQKCRQTLV